MRHTAQANGLLAAGYDLISAGASTYPHQVALNSTALAAQRQTLDPSATPRPRSRARSRFGLYPVVCIVPIFFLQR